MTYIAPLSLLPIKNQTHTQTHVYGPRPERKERQENVIFLYKLPEPFQSVHQIHFRNIFSFSLVCACVFVNTHLLSTRWIRLMDTLISIW